MSQTSQPPRALTAAAVAVVLLLGALRLSAQAVRQAPAPPAGPAQTAVQFRPNPAAPAFPDPADMQRLLQQMMDLQQQQLRDLMNQRGGALRLPGSPATRAVEARLGAELEPPGDALVEQLDLPAGQGQVLTRVTPGGAAARAGLQAYDLLLEVDGKQVPSDPAGWARAVAEIKPNTPVDFVVLRKGARKKLKGLSLPEAPAAPPAPGAGFGPRGGGLPFGPRGPGMFRPGFGLGNPNGSGAFNVRSEQGDVTIEVDGSIDDGVASVTDVTIREGGADKHYPSLEKVPAEYREKVRGLVERVTKQRAAPNP
jgi:hypothetical protein